MAILRSRVLCIAAEVALGCTRKADGGATPPAIEYRWQRIEPFIFLDVSNTVLNQLADLIGKRRIDASVDLCRSYNSFPRGVWRPRAGASASRPDRHRGAFGCTAGTVRLRRPQLLLLSEWLERSRILLVRLCLPPGARLGWRTRLAWLGSSSAACARWPRLASSYGRSPRQFSSARERSAGWRTVGHISECIWQRTWRWRRRTRSSSLNPRRCHHNVTRSPDHSGLFAYFAGVSALSAQPATDATIPLRKCRVDGPGRPLA